MFFIVDYISFGKQKHLFSENYKRLNKTVAIASLPYNFSSENFLWNIKEINLLNSRVLGQMALKHWLASLWNSWSNVKFNLISRVLLWKEQKTRNHRILKSSPISLSFPVKLTSILSCIAFLKGHFYFLSNCMIYVKNKKHLSKKLTPLLYLFFIWKRNSLQVLWN